MTATGKKMPSPNIVYAPADVPFLLGNTATESISKAATLASIGSASSSYDSRVLLKL